MARTDAFTIENPSAATVEQVWHLVRDVGCANPEWRAKAEARLQSLGHDAIPSLFAIMKVDARTRNDSVRVPWILFCLLVGVMCAGCIGMGAREGSLSLGITSVGLVLAIAGAARAAQNSFGTTGGLTNSELQLLLRVSDRRSIPVLMDLKSRLTDADQQWQIRVRLTELLPMIAAADSLPSRTRVRLIQSIRDAERWDARGDVQFAVATLQALGHVGGYEALPVVRRLSEAAGDDDIRSAARRCLPILQSRLRRHQIGATLLRPSQFSPSPAELVRAAGAPTLADCELLRPEVGVTG